MQLSTQPRIISAARILVISASVGAGHDGAAQELSQRLRAQGFDVVDLDFLDLVPAHLGRVVRAAYSWQLRRAPSSWGWLLGALQHGALSSVAAKLTATMTGRRVHRAATGAASASFDAVVSTYPLASQVLGQLRRSGDLDVPVITYLTDMSVHPLWIADGVDAHLALHAVAAGQAHHLGARGVRVTGPAVSARFRPVVSDAERDSLRQRFGLPVGKPLALVVAGSWGVGDIDSTVEDIARSGVATAVVACGHNTRLYARLKHAGVAVPIGWTDDMASLVRACDVVIQNAGGLSSLEALACGLPVLTYRCLSGHGQTNAAALAEAGWVPWIRTPEDLHVAVRTAIAGPVRDRVSTATASDPAATIAAFVPVRAGAG